MSTMEDLTKTQIVLLTLLVSFVTSIATGIITTSLLAEAPQSVTQTINRVVERTIEKVAPTPGGSSTTKEVTVIKEDDAVSSAIEKVSPAVVRISVRGADGNLSFYALGVIVNSSGLVLSSRENLILNTPYSVVLSDGSILGASVAYQSDTDNLVLFRIDADAVHKDKFPAVALSTNNLKLGQNIILLSGKNKNSVYINRVISSDVRGEKDAKGQDVSMVYAVETDILASSEISGSPIVNLSGELVGIKSPNADLTTTTGTYTTIFPIKRLIEKAK